MKHSFAVITLATLVAAALTSAQAGPIMKMLEEKKAKQAAGATSGSASTAQVPPAATSAGKNPAFETAKLKCKQLGNKEGSDKFNSCVMTLIE